MIIHEELAVVQKCQQIITEWLLHLGLELKPSKTRLTHTLTEYEGNVGFNFLGFTVRQYPMGKHYASKNTKGENLGFKALITPNQEGISRHQEKLKKIIEVHKASTQLQLINELNPVITGWSNYYSTVVSTDIFSKIGNWLYQQLRNWAEHRHPLKSQYWISNKYWLIDKGGGWRFAARELDSIKKIAKHSDTPVEQHIKVQNNRSPYDSEQLNTRFAALSTHFDLMQEFLATQNRITTALFSPETTLNYQQHFPFIEQVFEQNEQYLYCQRIFTLESDIFLYDHTLGGKPSHLHPEVTALPVIPFAVSMESLAEAAVYLGGENKCVTGIYNIRSYSWLALEAEQLIIDIVAQESVTDVDVQLFQVNQSGDRNLVFTGTVKLSSQFLPAPTPTNFYFENPRMYAWSDEELYKTGMFHGSRFQGVKHICQVSNNGIEADLEILGIDSFFSHIQEPIFQIDVILIDAAAQLIAFWIAASVGVDFHTFPVQITAFKQYQLLPPGSPVVGRGKMSFTSDKQIEASVDFFDAAGNIIAQIECLQEVFMFVRTKYHKCFTSPINAYLSDS